MWFECRVLPEPFWSQMLHLLNTLARKSCSYKVIKIVHLCWSMTTEQENRVHVGGTASSCAGEVYLGY